MIQTQRQLSYSVFSMLVIIVTFGSFKQRIGRLGRLTMDRYDVQIVGGSLQKTVVNFFCDIAQPVVYYYA